MVSISFEVPDDAVRVTVSFELPVAARRSGDLEVPLDLPKESSESEEVEGEYDDTEWERGGHIYSRSKDWTDEEIHYILSGSSRELRRWLRLLATHPDQVFTTSVSMRAVGLQPKSLSGMLSGITRRMRRRGIEKHMFFDLRNRPEVGEFEWRLRPREAKIVITWFEAGDRRDNG